MLDFGFSEILLTSAIALVVLGPERLPKVARQVGNWMGRARAMARQLSDQLEREVSADELLKSQTRKLDASTANRIAPAQGVPPAPVSHEIASPPSGHAEYEPPAAPVEPDVPAAPVAPTALHVPAAPVAPVASGDTRHESRLPPNE